MKRAHIAAAMGLSLLATPAVAEPVKVTGTVTDVFGSRFVLDAGNGRYLVEVGPKGMQKFKVKSGDKLDVEGNANANELRARRVTLPDGHAYEVGKKRNSWTTWLLGKPSEPPTPFTVASVKKIAADKGYALSSDPLADKKHFVATATKSGVKYDLEIYRDGRIVEKRAFGLDEAKSQATAQGYSVTGEVKPMMKHFRAMATKDGKPYELDIHRDGKVVAMEPFGVVEVKKLVTSKGYQSVSEPSAVDQHFEILAKKDTKFYELRAHRNGRVQQGRLVEANDPKWKSTIR